MECEESEEEIEDNQEQPNVLDDNQVSCSAQVHPPYCFLQTIYNSQVQLEIEVFFSPEEVCFII